MPLPSPDELEILLQLAQIGDIAAIQQKAEELSRQDQGDARSTRGGAHGVGVRVLAVADEFRPGPCSAGPGCCLSIRAPDGTQDTRALLEQAPAR